jgi:hypothetical protein
MHCCAARSAQYAERAAPGSDRSPRDARGLSFYRLVEAQRDGAIYPSSNLRRCNVAAIILVAVAIVAGGLTDIVPARTWEPIADTFKDVVLLLSATAVWRRMP